MYMLTIKGQFIINTEKEFYFDLLYCFMAYIRNGFALGIIEKIGKIEKFGKEKGKLWSFLKKIFFNSGSPGPHDNDLVTLMFQFCNQSPPSSVRGIVGVWSFGKMQM